MTPAQQRILLALERQPNMATADIADQAYVSITTLACGGYIRALKEKHLIHISGWRKVKGRFSTPLYASGNKPDVPRPKIDEMNRDAPGMHRIVDVLSRLGGLTSREIARFTGLSPNTVKNSGYLESLLAQKRIHVDSWRRSRNGPMSPVYAAGPGVNSAKLAVLTSGEKNDRYRAKHKILAQGSELRTQLSLLTVLVTTDMSR